MKKVKDFIKEHKELIIGVGVTVVLGVVVYKITKVNMAAKMKHLEDGQAIIKAFSIDSTLPVIETLPEAIEQFKVYQNASKDVAMFWENNTYSVLDL